MNNDLQYEPLDLAGLADASADLAANILHAMSESHIDDVGGLRLVRRRGRLGERVSLHYHGGGDLLSETIGVGAGDASIQEAMQFLEDADGIGSGPSADDGAGQGGGCGGWRVVTGIQRFAEVVEFLEDAESIKAAVTVHWLSFSLYQTEIIQREGLIDPPLELCSIPTISTPLFWDSHSFIWSSRVC